MSWIAFFLSIIFFLDAKIYDCFTFNHELDVLEIRLNEMSDYVDYFVLVECNETQRGAPKPFYFEMNQARFEKFKDKIIHIMVTDLLLADDFWARENYQRDQIIRGLQHCAPEDIVIISDVDEIIRGKDLPAIISHLDRFPSPRDRAKTHPRIHPQNPNLYPFIACQLDLFYYYLNGYVGQWNGPVITTFSNVRKIGANQVRNLRNSIFTVKNAGWHFTGAGGVEANLIKLMSNIHTFATTRESLKVTIETTPCIPVDSLFPQYVLDRLDSYVQRGFIKDKEHCTISRETIGAHSH